MLAGVHITWPSARCGGTEGHPLLRRNWMRTGWVACGDAQMRWLSSLGDTGWHLVVEDVQGAAAVVLQLHRHGVVP